MINVGLSNYVRSLKEVIFLDTEYYSGKISHYGSTN